MYVCMCVQKCMYVYGFAMYKIMYVHTHIGMCVHAYTHNDI